MKDASERAEGWEKSPVQQRERFLKAILDRVVVHPNSVEIRIHKEGLIRELTGKVQPQLSEGSETIRLDCPFRFSSPGKALRLILGNEQAPSRRTTVAILRSIARARAFREQLISGEATGIKHLAELHRMRTSHVRRIFQFAFLSPAAIEAILNEQIDPDLNLESMLGRIPLEWMEQSAIIGSK